LSIINQNLDNFYRIQTNCYSTHLMRTVAKELNKGQIHLSISVRQRQDSSLPPLHVRRESHLARMALFCWSCFGLFQLILSHRTLLNQPKPAGFSTSRTKRMVFGFLTYTSDENPSQLIKSDSCWRRPNNF
jgi:hypothetical protein